MSLQLKDTVEVKCENCGNLTFRMTMMLRKANKLLSGSSKDTVAQIPVMSCDKCGTVLEDSIPVEIKNLNKPKPSNSLIV